jgi:hypothetical protein
MAAVWQSQEGGSNGKAILNPYVRNTIEEQAHF